MTLALAQPAAAADPEIEFFSGLNLAAANGKPADDIPGFGFALQRALGDGWYLGFSLDHSPRFDFENTAALVDDIAAVGNVDADATHTMITWVGERRYALESPGWSRFWNLGGGFNAVDIDEVEGPVAGGGRYRIETDVELELVLQAGAGWVQRLGENWSLRYQIGAQYHRGEWQLRDRVSGNRGRIEDYLVYGIRLGLGYRD